MRLPFGIIETTEIITTTNKRSGEWCQLPYPNHPKGCPKYNQSETCPPKASHIADVLDLRRPIYIAFSEFNLSSHMAKMKKKHPKWTDLQLRCVLYWQNTSRNQMRKRAKLAQALRGGDTIIECPEGAGVNVYATCRANGLPLQRIRYLTICRHIALIGFNIDSEIAQTKLPGF